MSLICRCGRETPSPRQSVRTLAVVRVFFTGGSGKAGRHAIRYLVEQGHRVVNGDMVPLGVPGVADLRIDLTIAGQVFNALSAYAGLTSWSLAACSPLRRRRAFRAIPAILVRPDNETFRINTLSTYNVIDAAVKLGIRKVIFASAETTYAICFAEGEVRPEYVPIDEEHPTVPHDSYAMSKVVNEVTARSFQARTGIDIYGLRINNVIEPHEYETKFPAFVDDPGLRRRNIFAYIDARDLEQMVDCCLRTDGLGYEIFDVSNDDTSVGIPSDEVYERFYAGSRVDATWVATRRLRQRQGQTPRRIRAAPFLAQRTQVRPAAHWRTRGGPRSPEVARTSPELRVHEPVTVCARPAELRRGHCDCTSRYGEGLSKQSFAPVTKVFEVDAGSRSPLVRCTECIQRRRSLCSPGAPAQSSKGPGRDGRTSTGVRGSWSGTQDAPGDAGRHASVDDMLDAALAAWSARRILFMAAPSRCLTHRRKDRMVARSPFGHNSDRVGRSPMHRLASENPTQIQRQ